MAACKNCGKRAGAFAFCKKCQKELNELNDRAKQFEPVRKYELLNPVFEVKNADD